MTDREKETLCREVLKLQEKAMTFIRKHFSLTEAECEDVCQESLMALYNQINKTNFLLTSTLSCFFLGICNNKAREEIRKKGKMPINEKAMEMINEDRFDMNRVEQVLSMDSAPSYEELRSKLVEGIVSNLPSPCDKLLWGLYWDCLSMPVLTSIGGYKSEGVVRVKLSECRKKFRQRFLKERSSLY